MPLEIEAKMKLPDRERLLAALQAAGATSAGEVFETNEFYDTAEKALLADDRGLRLRLARNTLTGQVVCTMTHKGPRQEGPFKSREETELTVDKPAEARRMLECLGFHLITSFDKRRQSWLLDDCRIELDELPHLGLFVEIEGPSETAVEQTRQRLGLGDHHLIAASYIAMLRHWQQDHEDTSIAIRFPANPDQPSQ
jgi:adenylate cyclase, class 2